VIAGATVLIVVAQALAAPGGLDHSFDSDGKQTFNFLNGNRDDFGNELALDRNGRSVVVGYSDQGPPTGIDFAIARLDHQGNLDAGFSGDGRRLVDFAGDTDEALGATIQSDGRIVAVGSSEQGSATGEDFAIARLKPGGGLDTTFAGDGKRTVTFGAGNGIDSASDVAIQRDGRIVVVGTSDQGGVDKAAVARFKPGGALDKTFSNDGKRIISFGSGADTAGGVAIQGDGRIVVAGDSLQPTTGDDVAIARLNSSGTLDHGFSDDGKRIMRYAPGAGNDFAYRVAIRGTRIVVAGEGQKPATGRDFGVARFNSDGSLDHSFSNDGKRTFSFHNGSGFDGAGDLAIQSDGKIVVVGSSGQGGTTGDDLAIARLNPGGGLDPSFSGDGRRTLTFNDDALGDNGAGVAIQGNGRIVVAGYEGAGNSPAHPDFAVARFLGG
jgi:uncharacterized delta-60 repeat protein